jgi:hypothetical protein
MQTEELLEKIRSRVAQCRRLAGMITDPHARAVLLQMAAEGEADIERFDADRFVQDNERREA